MILVNLIFLYSPAPNQVPTNSIKCLPNEWINACFLRLGQISFRFSLWINFFDFCFPLLSCIIILNTRISDSMSLAVKRLIKSTKMVTGHYSGNIVPHTDYKTMHSHWTIHKLSWLYTLLSEHEMCSYKHVILPCNQLILLHYLHSTLNICSDQCCMWQSLLTNR